MVDENMRQTMLNKGRLPICEYYGLYLLVMDSKERDEKQLTIFDISGPLDH